MTLLVANNGDTSTWVARYPIGFVVAIALAVYFTPILRDAALRHGIVDHPDNKLKTHGKPTPYLGGVAVFLAFILAFGLLIPRFEHQVLGLLLGASIVLLLGFTDDLKAMSPMVKLLGQMLAAFVLLKAGIKIEIAFLPQYVAEGLTVLWIVGITNAFNIIDVMDGLSAGVGFVALMALFIIALMNGNPVIALFTICLAGAVLGFLQFNFRSGPASIYLGDAGSMLLGFLLGSLAMIMSYAELNSLAVVVPILLLGVPIFDTLFVMIMRRRQGIPVLRGSQDHFAVRLRRAGIPVRRIVIGSCAASALLAGAAFALMFLGRSGSILLLSSLGAIAVGGGIALSRTGDPGAPPPARPAAVLRNSRSRG